MEFLNKLGFIDSEIEEYDEGTPKRMQELINENVELVSMNISFLKDLGIDTYKDIFLTYPDMFLMDNSNFTEMFNKYEKDELVTKLNHNYKMVRYL